jgi:hypothetical protein
LSPAYKAPFASDDPLPYRAGHENHQRLPWSVSRFTDERLAHIIEHAELAGMEDEIERLLQAPTEVRRSRSDDNVMLFYDYTRTRVGGKWLCGVVKYLPDDAFVVTAYLTNIIKAGEVVSPKSEGMV